MSRLENAQSTEGLRRLAIDPVSRVEGHGKVTLLVDEQNRVQQARLHIVEFRGFERFIQGRPYWELPVIVQRLCGICPVSHHLAAGKAIDMRMGARHLPPSAEKLRRLLHFGQVLQSHALHFFHLASPDLVFGFEAPVVQRNVIALLESHPDIALKGIKLRKYGQEVIRVLSGKRVHGSLVVPGGVNKRLTPDEVSYLKSLAEEAMPWAEEAVSLARQLHMIDPDHNNGFARVASPTLSLVTDQGEMELYDGQIRVKGVDGTKVVDQFNPDQYQQLLGEEVKSWSYMKFPFLRQLDKSAGWYRVGPLARVLNADRIATPLAEQARAELCHEHPNATGSLLYHWARMIELLHCAEAISTLLDDPDLIAGEIRAPAGEPSSACFGVIEAPRGTLIHHYEIDEQDLVRQANLIVSTTSNNQAMNEAVRDVADKCFDGREISEGMLNQIEVAIRAYDPCLSCATHALGKMPLTVELRNRQGTLLHQASRNR